MRRLTLIGRGVNSKRLEISVGSAIFSIPPTGAAAQLIEFSVSACGRGASEEPRMGVDAHTHMRSSAQVPGGGARDGAARALQCPCRRAFYSTDGPVSEEMVL